MKITKISEDFAPVCGGILYELNTESESPSDLTVEIVATESEEVVATQQLWGVTESVINIAPYIARFEQMAPIANDHCSIVEAESATYHIRIGTLCSEPITIGANREEITAPSVPTAMPLSRRIAYGECDELPIVAEAGESIAVSISADNGETLSLEHSAICGVARLHLATRNFDSGISSLVINIARDGKPFAEVLYAITPPISKGIRLAWISESGYIERYTFPVVHKASRKVEKQCLRGADGVLSTNILSQSILSVASRYEPRKTIEALSQILSSPKVWIEQGGKFKEVEVQNLVVEYNLFGAPSIVELEVCEWQKEATL